MSFVLRSPMKIKIPLVPHYSDRFQCQCPRPELLMDVRGRDGRFLPMRFILDTGCDIITIPTRKARAYSLAFDESPANEIAITGSTGCGRGYRGFITIRFQGMLFRWPCAFSKTPARPHEGSVGRGYRVPLSLLGRAGFQDDWEFCIDDYFLTLVYRSPFRRWLKTRWRKLRGYPSLND